MMFWYLPPSGKADIFYAHAWNATPRHFGRSTYASAAMHMLIFVIITVQGQGYRS
jgi:hypothetical protein